ncbi:MAG: hypothetical protein AAF561_12275, partial [Planctomycetota bacterium]
MSKHPSRLTQFFVLALFVPMTALVGGCATSADQPKVVSSTDGVVISQTQWNGWEALRLTSDSTTAVVVPDVGRVMHYGRLSDGDEGNVLWRDPALNGVRWDKEPSDWQNYGGDKAWPWPQTDEEGWEQLQEGGWPPPLPFRGVAWSSDVEGAVVRLDLPEIVEQLNVRVHRTVEMKPNGNLVVATTFEPVGVDGLDYGAWHVTQIPLQQATAVVVGREEGALAPNWMGNDGRSGELFEFVRPLPDVGERPSAAIVPLEQSAKVGFDSDVLAAGLERPGGDVAFVQRVVLAEGERDLLAADRAQIYASPRGEPGENPGPWTELEFAAPIGHGSRLSVEWSLVDLAEDQATDPLAVAKAAASV